MLEAGIEAEYIYIGIIYQSVAYQVWNLISNLNKLIYHNKTIILIVTIQGIE